MDLCSQYKQIIREILEEISPYEEFDDHTDLIEAGILDSLAIVFLVTQLEDRFSIYLDEKLVIPQNFKTLQSISETLKKCTLKE